jgi:hypothetical protein
LRQVATITAEGQPPPDHQLSQPVADHLRQSEAHEHWDFQQSSQESQLSQGADLNSSPFPARETGKTTLLSQMSRGFDSVTETRPVLIDRLPASLKAAFEERAAIADVDGGLDRAAAERLAWDEVNAGPIGDTLPAWRAWMNYRIRAWMARRLSRAEAMHSVWAEAEYLWHCRHGTPADPDRCAGCGEWMLDGPGIRFMDRAVVHFGNPDWLDCLILYGQAWRGAASAGLVALGLKQPAAQP